LWPLEAFPHELPAVYVKVRPVTFEHICNAFFFIEALESFNETLEEGGPY
jgi:hypothetical protein